jgi:hypothetical protein
MVEQASDGAEEEFDGPRSLAIPARKYLWIQRVHSEPRASKRSFEFFSNL